LIGLILSGCGLWVGRPCWRRSQQASGSARKHCRHQQARYKAVTG